MSRFPRATSSSSSFPPSLSLTRLLHSPFPFLLVLCCFESMANHVTATVWDLNSYQLCRWVRFREVADNASGGALAPSGDALWIVINNPPELMLYDMEGNLRRRIEAGGWLRDPEEIVHVGPGSVYAVAEEGGDIVLVDLSDGNKNFVRQRIPIGFHRWGGAGLEGLAYDKEDDSFLAGNEKAPKAVYRVWRNGGYKMLVNGDASFRQLGDVAALYYKSGVKHGLFVLSQESSRIVQSDLSGNVVAQIDIRGTRPEGLLFSEDGTWMYVISEPNEMAVYGANGCFNQQSK